MNYIHNYYGEGKGKTTASLGLALRAVGAGKRVTIIQFLKKGDYSETKSLNKLGIDVKQFGSGEFILNKPSKKDIALGQEGVNYLKDVIVGRKFDVIILDEVNTACSLGIIKSTELVDIILSGKHHSEIILTGRDPDRILLEASDLISRINCEKHYYNIGVDGRLGIEF